MSQVTTKRQQVSDTDRKLGTVSRYTLLVDGQPVGCIEQMRDPSASGMGYSSKTGWYLKSSGPNASLYGDTRGQVKAQFERMLERAAEGQPPVQCIMCSEAAEWVNPESKLTANYCPTHLPAYLASVAVPIQTVVRDQFGNIDLAATRLAGLSSLYPEDDDTTNMSAHERAVRANDLGLEKPRCTMCGRVIHPGQSSSTGRLGRVCAACDPEDAR